MRDSSPHFFRLSTLLPKRQHPGRLSGQPGRCVVTQPYRGMGINSGVAADLSSGLPF
jgi:hypothetical protein